MLAAGGRFQSAALAISKKFIGPRKLRRSMSVRWRWVDQWDRFIGYSIGRIAAKILALFQYELEEDGYAASVPDA